MATGAPVSAGFFEPQHIFVLRGHAAHNVEKNESGTLKSQEERRYALKDNEFYASAIKCGRVSLMRDNSEIDNFILSKTPLEIPSPDMPSFYTESFPFKTVRQHRQNTVISRFISNNQYKRIAPIQLKEHKIYAPFLKNSKSSSTIPNSNISLLSKFEVSPFNIDKNVLRNFTFEGKPYNIEPTEATFYRLHISGVVSAGNDTIKTRIEQAKLRSKSNQIKEIFRISEPDETSLFIIVPGYCLDKIFKNDYADDPLVNYLKDAILAMSSDSIVEPYYSPMIGISNHFLKFRDKLYKSVKLSKIFYVISYIFRKAGLEHVPFIVINDLCRYAEDSGVIDTNYAYSNNESNKRSYASNHYLHKRKGKKIINNVTNNVRSLLGQLLNNNIELTKRQFPNNAERIEREREYYRSFRHKNSTKRFLNTARNKYIKKARRVTKKNLSSFLNGLKYVKGNIFPTYEINSYIRELPDKTYILENITNNE